MCVRLLCKQPVLGELTCEYAKVFHARLVSAAPPAANWPSDIEVPFASYGEIVVSMASNTRAYIGMISLGVMSGAKTVSFRSFRLPSLQKEVKERMCVLLIDGDGQPLRVVTVVALRLVRDDGRVLAQLGKLRGGTVQMSCAFPGVLLKEGELPTDGKERLLQSELATLKSGVVIKGVDTVKERKYSNKHNVNTEYIRYVYSADFLTCSEPELVIVDTVDVDTHEAHAPPGDASWSLHGRWSLHVVGHEAHAPGAQIESIFALTDGDRVLLCAWITEEQLNFFATPNGETALRSRLSTFQVHEDEIARRCRELPVNLYCV